MTCVSGQDPSEGGKTGVTIGPIHTLPPHVTEMKKQECLKLDAPELKHPVGNAVWPRGFVKQ